MLHQYGDNNMVSPPFIPPSNPTGVSTKLKLVTMIAIPIIDLQLVYNLSAYIEGV